MGADIEFNDNSEEVLRLMRGATLKGAEMSGMALESAAKRLCQPKGPNGNPMRDGTELRNSITHVVRETPEGPELSVGTNMQIGPYVETGTGKEYDPSPEWIETHSSDKHSKGGLDEWIYFDELEQVFRIGKPIPAQPYLRPAFLNNVDTIKGIMQSELENA